MLTMVGNRGPMMVETRGLKEVNLVHKLYPESLEKDKNFSSFQANTEKPEWNEEELETRTGVMSLVKFSHCQLENCHIG